MDKTNELINYLIHNKVDELDKLYKTQWNKNINFKLIFDKISNQFNPSANNFLGFMYKNGRSVEQDYKKALYYYQLAVDQGNAIAQTNLAFMYQNGKGIEQDYEKALHYYQLAADQGVSIAQNNLGDMYQYSKGVEQDYEKALHYYQLAADQGNAIAQNNIKILLSDWSNNGLNKYIKTKTTKYKELEDRCKELEEENVHLRYKPGGPGYYESIEHFEKYQ